MKKVLAVVLSAILILQAGLTTVHAEKTEDNRRVIVICHVDALPLDDEIVPYATIIKTYGFSAANIEIINEKWIIPHQFVISGKDIPINDGKYSYQLKLKSDGTLTFGNDLEIYYQGIDGLYKLDYEIDKTDNHSMIVNGVFDNIIVASPVLDMLPEKCRNTIVSKISDDSYDYKLDLQTDYGFSFQNKLQFLFGSTELSFSTKYDYDLPTDLSTVMVCWTRGEDSYVIGPIEFKPICETSQKVIDSISSNIKGLKIEDISANIKQILKENKDVVSQIKEKAGSVLIPSVRETISKIEDAISDNEFTLPDYDLGIQIGSEIRDRVEDFIGFWN